MSFLYEFSPGAYSHAYFHTNAHGDTVFTTNKQGQIIATASYDPFGGLNGTTAMSNTRWQGSWQDTVTGLYYVRARWYAPSLGRFLSSDPLAGAIAHPQSLNRYAYVAGNPMGGVDPNGTCTFDTRTMSCVDATTGVDQSNFNRDLEAANAAPVNKCLQTNFHADGCSSGALVSSVALDPNLADICAQTNYHADQCRLVSTASPELLEASGWVSGNMRQIAAREASTGPVGAVTLEEATTFFEQQNARKDLHWEYVPDGCWARAYLVGLAVERNAIWMGRGVTYGKVWLFGDLQPETNWPDPSWYSWQEHIAVTIYVELPGGRRETMVIDPAVCNDKVHCSGPLSIQDWRRLATGPTGTSKDAIATGFRQGPYAGRDWYTGDARYPGTGDDPCNMPAGLHVDAWGKGSQVREQASGLVPSLEQFSLERLRLCANKMVPK